MQLFHLGDYTVFDFNALSRCPCNKLTQYMNVFSRKSNVNNYITVMETTLKHLLEH